MSIMIDCGTCCRQHSSTCDDCVVSYILSNGQGAETPEVGVVVEASEFFALRRLQNAGLVPALRHERAAGE